MSCIHVRQEQYMRGRYDSCGCGNSNNGDIFPGGRQPGYILSSDEFGLIWVPNTSGGGDPTIIQNLQDSVEALQEAVDLLSNPYTNGVFTSFIITGQNTTVEVGTTLVGTKNFTWGLTPNSANITGIDILDITASTALVSNTPNDGNQNINITTRQLNTNGITQAFRAVATDSNNSTTINSVPFIITARFYHFLGAVDTSPTNSAQVRALTAGFHTAGSFTLSTGINKKKFIVALPPGTNIGSVIDQTSLNADITNQYLLTGTVDIIDAGGTNRAYNIYEMNTSVPYGINHNHYITTN